MSMSAPHEIYVRHTSKDGSSYVQEHRVWDAERFMRARQDEAQQAGGKAAAQQLTLEQFQAQKK
ncbi:MAG: hypothetical protein LBJ15_18365 [Comamonas sp.]|jgi:hypothetical protein|uniref:hypothetical protein n=1 Tax=Comamonas sp. TaxID=34028 RepID=UPI00281B2C95|nr:hypothetical protein [Comamonas sp.]MDR0215942.1 hypothetical protein [Comamonas sp.]